MNKIILAIVGLPGAGKNEVTEYLMKKMKTYLITTIL